MPPPVPSVPFFLLRPWLLTRDLVVDRERPDLDGLRRIEDPEDFVWEILPHAARTFSACIALLPATAALPAAVGYLYCRSLDTFEDLVPDADTRDDALARFASRLDVADDAAEMEPAPVIEDASACDERDLSHLLLVERCALVDRVYLSFGPGVRRLIRELVRDMADGMRWSSRTFEAQGGVLDGQEQLSTYCHHVLGNPVHFTMRLLQLVRTGDADLPPELTEACMTSGEFFQLANVTRDVEKDLKRGIAYCADLKDAVGRDPAGDAELTERIRGVRARLLHRALECAPSYRGIIEAMRTPRWNIARAAALLMLVFTDRYYRGCATRAGVETWGPRPGWALLLMRVLPGVLSIGWCRRVFASVVADFSAAAPKAEVASRPKNPS